MTYRCPNSCAMVKAADSPLSCTMAQDAWREHIVPSSARPRVSQFCVNGLRQMFSLK